jgi:preprotein translocase SecE subunit
MAVAVTNTTETAPRPPLSRLAVGSLVGTLYVLASLALVFYALPKLWEIGLTPLIGKPEVDTALRFLSMLALAVGLTYYGWRLLGPSAVHGQRAGIALGLVLFVLAALVTLWVGDLLEGLVYRGHLFGESGPMIGRAVTLAVGAALLFLLVRFFFRPGFARWAAVLEDQGWFTASSYKKNQGQRVRRGTIVGILALAGCGVYTMLAHHTLEGGPQSWVIQLPFTGVPVVNEQGAVALTGHRTLTLLPDVRFTLPILLTGLALWLGYRLVNFPVFADFLIATEAELNKVSWTTRKRLVQDTIVVLTTMLLITFFIFVVDVIWVKVLSSPWIQVLQTSSKSEEEARKQLDW